MSTVVKDLEAEIELEAHAAVVHALLGSGYLFTLYYHGKRKNVPKITIALLGGWYHLYSTNEHIKEIKKLLKDKQQLQDQV